MHRTSLFGAPILGRVALTCFSKHVRSSGRSFHRSNKLHLPESNVAAAATRSNSVTDTNESYTAGTGWSVRQLRKTKTGLEILWDNDEKSLFHYEWLYRNRPDVFFTCGQNMQKPTARMEADVNGISAAIASDGDTLRLKWDDSGSPESFFKLAWLRQCAYSKSWLSKLATARKPVPIRTRAAAEISCVEYDYVMQDDRGVKEWLENVNRDGLCLMRGVPLTPGTVSTVAERIGPVMQTIYGTQFDVQAVQDPINVAYSNEGLDLHQDLAYYESPPALQHLHCLRFDASIVGGESTFADGFHCAELLRECDPQAFHTLCRVPATFQKIHYDRPDPVHLQHKRPHLAVNHQNDVVGVFWAPPFEGPLQVPEEDVLEYFRAYNVFAQLIEAHDGGETRLETKLEPGVLVTFNNRRMLHGRSRFHEESTGGRHLQGCYTSMEVYVNRLRVLQNRVLNASLRSPGIPITRVGDQDFS